MGRGAPMRPMRSEYIRHFFFGFIEHSAFLQLLEDIGRLPEENEFLPPRARRNGVQWPPLGELRTPVLLSTNARL